MTTDDLRYGGAPSRRERILDALRRGGFLSISVLSRQLGVSDMTIRRDLRRLAEAGQARVVHGGASLPHPRSESTTSGFADRTRANAAAKAIIAERAIALIRPDDTIAVDAGSTAYLLAESLPEDFRGVVITNSVPVIQLFVDQPGRRVLGLGGDLVHSSQAFAGPMTADDARRLRADTFFLGAAAVDRHGCYVAADVERTTKLAFMDIADRVILLADHEKFSRRAPVLLAPLERVDTVVTDRVPDELAPVLAAAGVRISAPPIAVGVAQA